MITVTNDKEEFVIKDRTLCFRDETLKGKAIVSRYDYWGIELLFVINKKDEITKIAKCYIEGDSYLNVYKNLLKNSRDKVLLNDKDYNEIKKLYNNMQQKNNLRKKAIIESAAIMFSYEYYQNYNLEQLQKRVSIDEIFNYYIGLYGVRYKQYKKEIIKRSKVILLTTYNIEMKEK